MAERRWWEQEADGSDLQLWAGIRVNWRWQNLSTFKATSSDTVLPTRPCLLNLPKQYHQLGTKCSHAHDCGMSHSNHQFEERICEDQSQQLTKRDGRNCIFPGRLLQWLEVQVQCEAYKSGWHKWLKHLGSLVRTTERIRVANVCVQSGPDHGGKRPVLSAWGCGSCPAAPSPRPSIAREYCAVYCQLREKKLKSQV